MDQAPVVPAPTEKPTFLKELLRVILSAGTGVGVGSGIWLATGSFVLGMCFGSATATLANNFFRNVIK